MRAWLCGLLALASSGCVAGELWKTRESQEALASYAFVGGTVEAAEPADAWMVVFVARLPCGEDWSLVRDAVERGELPSPSPRPELRDAIERGREQVQLVQHVVLQRAGRWYARLAPGCYGIGAFEDLNHDYRYEDEPALQLLAPGRMIELAAGERREGLALRIPKDGRLLIASFDPVARQVSDLAVRSLDDQDFVSLDAVAVTGAVANLDDPRFGPANGKLGYFDVHDFAWKVGPGIYFLEPYDPKKIPVLFVHGAEGFPQNFAPLIRGLDRTRFQPWVFFYPSGAALEAVAHFLVEQVSRLELRHGFGRMAVVAHSMGGLVTRDFLLEHHERVKDDPIGLFVSISTPWEGVASAEKGVAYSPVVVSSWRDVASGSPFLHRLFFEDDSETKPRHLPDQIAYHLIFGVKDQTISVPSAVRWQVVREARDRWPLAYGHVDILASPEASQLLNEILARFAD